LKVFYKWLRGAKLVDLACEVEEGSVLMDHAIRIIGSAIPWGAS